VILFNRDIKPGGLAEYGIYPEKYRMKDGLRNQFRQIIDREDIEYYGNITIGDQADLSLSELKSLGFQAVLVTAGAQGTKWLGLPGEKLSGVYHAKDIVYHYNHLPPFSHSEFRIGRRVAVVGAGNVSLDIARYLASLSQVEEIIAVVRRGPAEIKFSRAELENVVNLRDLDDLAVQMKQLIPLMQSLGQNPEDVYSFIRVAQERACETGSKAKFRLRFLISPTRITGNANQQVIGLEVEENTSIQKLFTQKMSGENAEDYLIRVNRQPVPRDYVLQEKSRITYAHGSNSCSDSYFMCSIRVHIGLDGKRQECHFHGA
jgi:ferredoxin--NADP+ reductase